MAVVLVYRALGLGDFLTGVPAYRALARAFPAHRVVLAAPRVLAPLSALTDAIDEVVDTRPLGPAPRGADVAVNLHGRGPQSHRLLRAASPRRLIAFGNGVQWREHEHEVARWCRLLNASGIPADQDELDLPRPPTGPAPGATVIHPGAASAARRWPPERFAEVARHELAHGRDVVVTGAAGDELPVPGAIQLAGRTDLGTLAALVAHAGRVVCGDTGVAHLATAFGTPSVVLFGPTPPHEWGPPPNRPQHRALWAGERGDPHATRPDAGLLRIQVDDVIEALMSSSGATRAGYAEGMSITDKVTGRIKKAAGDLADDASLRREGRDEERKGEAKDELARAHDKADRKAEEVADLERRT